MGHASRISPFLWFDHQAEEAAQFYTGIFPNSRIGEIARYGAAGHEVHDRPAGSVMTVRFELDGQPFVALNGGPHFQFNEAVSLQVLCETQDEVDYYWEKLSAGGDEHSRHCGWLKDRYGLSWQVVPAVLPHLVADPDPARSGRVVEAIMKMKKLDIAELERAHAG
jgi:predicted 3-demethylubiquinone-9 3-methyltransferase (glyoxalase superfamily)